MDTIVSKEGLLQSFLIPDSALLFCAAWKENIFPKTYSWVYGELQLES